MTDIWRMCLAQWAVCRQKGQIIVFTAVLLPLIIAACGFTVDFGSMYVHKSKLQNAADAAAIAGAAAYRDNNNTPDVDGHIHADYKAELSVRDNLANWRDIECIYQAREVDDGTTYYRVLLTEEVPVYFLRLFDVGDTVDISAAAVASIVATGGGSDGTIFDNLFSFGSIGLDFTNTNQNPDNIDISKINEATFYHGRIVGIGADAKMERVDDRHELLDTAAKDGLKDGKYTTVKEAVEAGDYIKLEQDKDKTLDEQLKNIMAGVNSSQGKEYNWDNGKDVKELAQFYGINYIYNKNGGNPELNINEPLKKLKPNDNTPLYIVCDYTGQIKLTPKSTTIDQNSRPIVFVCPNADRVQIDPINGAYFRGIIYAPNALVHINDHAMTFYGSIAAKGLTLTGKGGTYIHENFLGDFDSGNGSHINGGTGNAIIGLASPPDNISWQ